MKLLSIELELKTIISICRSPNTLAITLLGMVSAEHFYYEPVISAYHRIMSLIKNSGDIPDYIEIQSDPVLQEEHRKILIANTEKPATQKEQITSMVRSLEKYRKMRILFRNSENTIKALTSSQLDLDTILDKNSRALMQARSTGTSHSLVHFGRGNNSSSIVKRLLSNENPPLIPTGFKTFDKRNGGIYLGSLFVVAATTGGGKTTLAGQLLVNMTKAGHDVALVPLEMSAEESTARLMGTLSGVEISKYLLRKVTARESKKTISAYKRYVNELKESNTRYSIFKPQEDMTAEEILFILKPYGYKVIIIDYISLLKGVGGDDSWQQLGNVARYCKVFAENNKVIVILLAQLNKEGEVRYARSIGENANNMWIWVMTDEDRETGIMDIRQYKSRNQDPFPFQLAQDFKRMQVRDLKTNEGADMSSTDGEQKRQDLDSYLSDISDGDNSD